eukprot:GEMP01005397.1.p1 GENE.GEMP01005397.1~~GEMP01005397.1.p1  ORF type:complete len:609 (+),score=149.16 GEMP01005397.1:74-1900(+)
MKAPIAALASLSVIAAQGNTFQGETPTEHCTAFAISQAMVDGSSIASQSNDADGIMDFRLVHVPRRRKPANATGQYMRQCYGDYIGYPRIKDPNVASQYVEGPDGFNTVEGEIPEVDETYAYWDGYYGLQNEHQLSIGESTCSATFFTKPKSKGGHAIMWVGTLTKIAMERCKTSLCAVQLMGDLAYKYGYFADGSASGAGEALVVVDPFEAWVFHILASPCGKKAVWAAQQVPQGHIAVVANAFVIREMDLDNRKRFLASPDIVEVARKYLGKHYHRTAFDFTKAFGGGEYVHPFYSQRRVWRIYDILAPHLHLKPDKAYSTKKPTYPFSVKPRKPIALETLFAIYRDHYEGTPYDLTKGAAAGPWGNPNRYDAGPNEKAVKRGAWERSIGVYRTSYIQIAQTRNVTDGGIIWWAPSRPEATAFVPIFGPQVLEEAPESLGSGNNWELDDGFWWTCQQLAHFMELKYSVMQPQVHEVQVALEKVGVSLADDLLKGISTPEGRKAASTLIPAHVASTHQALEKWRRFFLVKYQNGYELDAATRTVATPGYPEEWLKLIRYDKAVRATKKEFKRQEETLHEAQVIGTKIMEAALRREESGAHTETEKYT